MKGKLAFAFFPFYGMLKVAIDSNLNWNKHIDYICQKISKT